MALPSGLAPLRHRDFAIYWVGQLFANVGRQFETTATLWLLYDLSQSPLLLGAAGLGRGGTVIALTLFAGAFIDRVGSRTVVLWTQAVFALLSMLIAILLVTGLLEPWHLVATATVSGAVLAFDAPARQSMYAWLVPREELAAAVPLNTSVRQIGLVAGPSLAGLVISLFGALPIYLANAATFGGLLISVLLIRTRQPLLKRSGSLLRNTLQGAVYIARTPVLAGLMVMLMLFSTFSHGPALFTIFASDVLHSGPAGLGALGGATGAGAVLGGLLAVALASFVHRQGALLLAAGVGYSGLLLLFGLSAWMPLSLAIGLGLGVGQAIVSIMANTLVQLASPDELRGRVISFHVLVTRGFDAFGAVQVGVLTSLVGPQAAVALAAAALGLCVVGLGVLVPPLRRFRALAT